MLDKPLTLKDILELKKREQREQAQSIVDARIERRNSWRLKPVKIDWDSQIDYPTVRKIIQKAIGNARLRLGIEYGTLDVDDQIHDAILYFLEGGQAVPNMTTTQALSWAGCRAVYKALRDLSNMRLDIRKVTPESLEGLCDNLSSQWSNQVYKAVLGCLYTRHVAQALLDQYTTRLDDNDTTPESEDVFLPAADSDSLGAAVPAEVKCSLPKRKYTAKPQV